MSELFLWVQNVSRIFMVDGTSFVQGILEGDDSQHCYQTTLAYSFQKKKRWPQLEAVETNFENATGQRCD